MKLPFYFKNIFYAPFLITYYVLNLLLKNNFVKIVNVSSMVQAGTFGIESKFDLEKLGKDASIKGYGIRCY